MGSGFKDWAAGDVLTAADVDGYLMRQTVMTFADASARDTALSGVLDEGMVAYLEDINTTSVYDGSAWKLTGGPILQVVSTTKADTFSASVASAAAADVTGLSVAITPRSSTSKVLVSVNMNGFTDVGGGSYRAQLAAQLKRSTTVIGGGTAVGNRTSASATAVGSGLIDNLASVNLSFSYLDSPATTSATTYQVAVFNSTGATFTLLVNVQGIDTDAASIVRTSSTITAMEIAQ